MIDQQNDASHSDAPATDGVPPSGSRPAPVRGRQVARRELPQYRVVLHVDDFNEIDSVIRILTRLTPLNRLRATVVTLHAHYHGDALILITHKERAELYAAQFRQRRLTVSIVPDA
jgi:ATP-dependent Clp protease adapter protein ClpS